MCKHSCCKRNNIIPVRQVEITDTEVQLITDAVVSSELVCDNCFCLMVDLAILPNSSLPVVLVDSETNDTIPLTQENGNVMRETKFKVMCMHAAKCHGNHTAFLKCFYGDDSPHVLVFNLK